MNTRQGAIGIGLGIILLLVVAGCAATATGNKTTSEEAASVSGDNAAADEETTEAVEADTEQEEILLAGTNIARHSVPLEEIYIDTFNGSSVRLSEASEETLLRLRDAIPPIDTPKYTDVATADRWLKDEDTVVGYVDGDTALAYPTKILNYHEIVNETVNGKPVLISYCPLCNSGIVYDRRLGDRVLEFGNTSGLYQSDMVMYDRQTFSYWFQVEGAAIVGELTGQQMEVLPTRFMRWADWRETYPDSQVLSRETGFDRPYDRDPFADLPTYLNRGNFAFPVSEAALNPALPAGTQVVSVVINEEARAYSLEQLAGTVVNDEEVGGVPIAVAIDEAETATVFDRRLGDQVVQLEWAGDQLVDTESGTLFDSSGQAIEGPLSGESLTLLPTRFSFWFAFIAAFPEGTAY